MPTGFRETRLFPRLHAPISAGLKIATAASFQPNFPPRRESVWRRSPADDAVQHDRIAPGCAQALHDALRGRRFRQEIVGANLAIDLREGGTGRQAAAIFDSLYPARVS